jgi:hypothetical protein
MYVGREEEKYEVEVVGVTHMGGPTWGGVTHMGAVQTTNSNQCIW